MDNKPKNLLDIKERSDAFRLLPRRVNLYRGREVRFSLKKWLTPAIVAVTLFFFVFGGWNGRFASAPTGAIFAAENAEERAQLEAQLADLEKQIAEYESTLSGYKQQGNTLKSEIDRLNAKISKLNLQIKAVNYTISQLDSNIKTTEGEIDVTESDIGSTKVVVGKLLQNMYEAQAESAIEIFLQNPTLSDFFTDVNSLFVVQDNLRDELQKLIVLRDDLIDKKETLALQKSDAQAVKAYQDKQRGEIQLTKGEKDTLLKVTKGQESKYQELVTQTKKTAAEIRSRIFRLLGGGELPFGEAVKIAKVAERATGVRAALILAVLTQESSINGVIGANLGRCYYNDPRSNKSGTVMSDSQKPAFLALMAALQLDPTKTPVSCPIVSDGAYGGAMGPAQFMPTTWDLYKKRIAGITGGNPASPFNNLDAFTGTALYLQDGLEGCKSIYKTLFSQESCAAAKYYAGGKWRSYMSVGRYGYRVAERAAGFAKDIEIIEGN